jgi:hypothetical protein
VCGARPWAGKRRARGVAHTLQHFGNDAGCSEYIEQIDLAEMVGVHKVAKHVDRTGDWKRIFLFFKFFDQKGKQLGQPLLLGCARSLSRNPPITRGAPR